MAALINDEKRTQREVADVAGVTEVTIRNRYKELLEELDLERDIKKTKKKTRRLNEIYRLVNENREKGLWHKADWSD